MIEAIEKKIKKLAIGVVDYGDRDGLYIASNALLSLSQAVLALRQTKSIEGGAKADNKSAEEFAEIMSLLDSKNIESEVDGKPLTPYERVLRVLAQAEGKDIIRTRFVGGAEEYAALKQDAQELKDAHAVLDDFNIHDLDADGKIPLRIRMQVYAMNEVDKANKECQQRINSVCKERDKLTARLESMSQPNEEIAELVAYLNRLNVAREGLNGILSLKERVRLAIDVGDASHEFRAAMNAVASAHRELSYLGIPNTDKNGNEYDLDTRIDLLDTKIGYESREAHATLTKAGIPQLGSDNEPYTLSRRIDVMCAAIGILMDESDDLKKRLNTPCIQSK